MNILNRITFATLTTALLFPLTTFAGNLDSATNVANGSAMPSTADIYNQLVDGTTRVIPSNFQEPTGAPTAPTGRSLAEILPLLPVADAANAAILEEVIPGKTFWGLKTGVTTWGAKTGAAVKPLAKLTSQ